MGIKRMKAIELVLDWSLWPRQSIGQLDITNVNHMKMALRNGAVLPPVIANEKDYRVVDGFHRTKAVLELFGDDAEIDVDLQDFQDEQEMFLAAGRYNSHHGQPMRPKDRVHFIARARKMKIPWPAIAGVLDVPEKVLKNLYKERTAKTEDGEIIPLSYGARGLAGQTLTPVQEHFVRHGSTGSPSEVHINILINTLQADALELSERTVVRLRILNELINNILADEVA